MPGAFAWILPACLLGCTATLVQELPERARPQVRIYAESAVPEESGLEAEEGRAEERGSLQAPREFRGHSYYKEDGTLIRSYYFVNEMATKIQGLLQTDLGFGEADLRVTPTAYRTAKSKNDMYLVQLVGSEEKVLAAEDYINTIFGRVPQIEIEVRVLEVTTDDQLELGAETILTEDPSDERTFFEQSVNTFNTESFLSSLTSGTPFIGSRSFFSAIQDDIRVETILEALAAYNKTEVLSHPRIAVVNGELATIETTETVFVQNVESIEAAGRFKIKVQPTDAGVKLNVTPFLVGTDTIRLEITAEVSAITGFTDPGPNGVSNPIINRRKADTVVHVREGQTTIIGGLISQDTFELETKVPLLGDIPLLGYFFKRIRNSVRKRELIYIITPHLIAESVSAGSYELIIPSEIR